LQPASAERRVAELEIAAVIVVAVGSENQSAAAVHCSAVASMLEVYLLC